MAENNTFIKLLIKLNLFRQKEKAIEKEGVTLLDRDDLINKGWKRGSIIKLSSLKLLVNLPKQFSDYLDSDQTYAIITTYDCGLINGSLDSEPWFYVTIAKEIDELKADYTYAKHERIIHFSASICNEEKFLEAKALGCQVMLDRTLLNQIDYIKDSTVVEFDDLLKWVSERTMRSTFEDRFNRETSKKAKKAFGDARMKNVTSVLINIDYKKNSKTKIKLILTCKETLPTKEYKELEDVKVSKKTLLERMESIFCNHSDEEKKTCKCGYDPQVFLISEGELPISFLRNYKKWSPDYFSFKHTDGSAERPVIGNGKFDN